MGKSQECVAAPMCCVQLSHEIIIIITWSGHSRHETPNRDDGRQFGDMPLIIHTHVHIEMRRMAVLKISIMHIFT